MSFRNAASTWKASVQTKLRKPDFHTQIPLLCNRELRCPRTQNQQSPGAKLPCGQGQLVLVVDDEPNVRDITSRILEKSGYPVLTANKGTAAIALYTRRQAEIEVVLTDMMMPVMDGPATVRVLRRMNPQVKIIAASGAASKATLGEIADLPVQAYLQKPFASEDILITLDKVLRGEQTRHQPGV